MLSSTTTIFDPILLDLMLLFSLFSYTGIDFSSHSRRYALSTGIPVIAYSIEFTGRRHR